MRTANPANTLLLDSGNLLFKRSSIGHGINQERLTAEAILQIYQESKYDAVGVGPLDLAGGLEFLLTSQTHGFPWVSANITDSTGKPLFQQWIKRRFATEEVAITAVMPTPALQIPGIIVQPWQESLSTLLATMSKQNSELLIIVLSTLSTEENSAMAKLFPQIRIIIGADSKKANISPKMVNKSLLTQTGRQGKYQGLLTIDFGRVNTWGQESSKELAALQNRLGSLKWQLRRIEKRKPDSPNFAKLQVTAKRLRAEELRLKHQITAMQEITEKEKTDGARRSHYSYRFIELGESLPNDTTTKVRLEELTLAIRTLHQETKAKAKQKGAASTSLDADYNITGYKVCAVCHTEQTAFWEDTAHAAAYLTLVKKKKNLDLDCLPCHVTLDFRTVQMDKLSRDSLLSYPIELVSVGCETCHGAGKKHSVNPVKFSMVSRASKKICLNCHNPEHDDNFAYNDKIMTISCPTL